MIKRREFLKFLPGIVFLPFSATKTREQRKILILEDYVAGFQYYQGDTSIARLKAGDPLRLKREPANTHDEMAIAVYAHDGVKLGYIHRFLNIIPSGMLDRGTELTAMVTRINFSPAPSWERVRFVVYHPVG